MPLLVAAGVQVLEVTCPNAGRAHAVAGPGAVFAHAEAAELAHGLTPKELPEGAQPRRGARILLVDGVANPTRMRIMKSDATNAKNPSISLPVYWDPNSSTATVPSGIVTCQCHTRFRSARKRSHSSTREQRRFHIG